MASRIRRLLVVVGIGLLGASALQPVAAQNAAPPAAIEAVKPAPAANYLGSVMKTENYTVRPSARSDGLMRIFEVDSKYGVFQFEGVDFTKLRLREIEAAAAIEKMSQSEEWGKSFGRAAVAPLKFGVDFIMNPAESINRSATGIGNMFDRASAGMAGQKYDRDNMADSLLGVSDSQRQLAYQLVVDPYTDFPPLQDRLQQMSRAMAGGSLTVRAGLAAVTGGIGIGISAASNLEGAKETLRDKTAAQVLAEVKATLLSLGVPEDIAVRFMSNRAYTPSFLLLTTRALANLNAQNTAAFIDVAARAPTHAAAFLNWKRAELLMTRSAELGGLVTFVPVAGHALNIARDGKVVAVYPFDDLAWTEMAKRVFLEASAEKRQRYPTAHAIYATSGQVSPLASTEMKKLGWQVVHLKPAPRISDQR